jgi:hypothetical protein
MLPKYHTVVKDFLFVYVTALFFKMFVPSIHKISYSIRITCFGLDPK